MSTQMELSEESKKHSTIANDYIQSFYESSHAINKHRLTGRDMMATTSS